MCKNISFESLLLKYSQLANYKGPGGKYFSFTGPKSVETLLCVGKAAMDNI
jgi:hypothetical protein